MRDSRQKRGYVNVPAVEYEEEFLLVEPLAEIDFTFLANCGPNNGLFHRHNPGIWVRARKDVAAQFGQTIGITGSTAIALLPPNCGWWENLSSHSPSICQARLRLPQNGHPSQ